MKENENRAIFTSLFERVNELLGKRKKILLAIDGNSAAGKTSLAELLKTACSCNVFHMDDFFLQPHQRTPERLSEAGGNVDYERFAEEVINPLKTGGEFSYRPYDCRTETLSAPTSVTPRRLNIIEGVYSLHPSLIEAYDIKIFLRLNSAEQKRRLMERNAGLYDRFVEEWLPMERQYFDAFTVAAKCDFVFEEKRRGI